MLSQWNLFCEDWSSTPSLSYAVGLVTSDVSTLDSFDKWVQDHKGRIYKSAREYVEARLFKARRGPDLSDDDL